MLKIERKQFYKVKKGQTLAKVARAFCLSERVLAKANKLNGEIYEGQILYIPNLSGNAYTATPADTPALLCGSKENFIKKNGDCPVYPGMRVIL